MALSKLKGDFNEKKFAKEHGIDKATLKSMERDEETLEDQTSNASPWNYEKEHQK